MAGGYARGMHRRLIPARIRNRRRAQHQLRRALQAAGMPHGRALTAASLARGTIAIGDVPSYLDRLEARVPIGHQLHRPGQPALTPAEAVKLIGQLDHEAPGCAASAAAIARTAGDTTTAAIEIEIATAVDRMLAGERDH